MTDSLRILDSISHFPDQCHQVLWEIAQAEIPQQCFLSENIVVSGMGGSALGGRIISSLERQVLKIPLVVSTEYHLPNFVNQKSLVIVSSYSGNTEETIYSLGEARARDAQIFVITTGGKLANIAKSQSIPHYLIDPKHNPSNQPRMGLGYSIMSIVSLLSSCQLIHPLPRLSNLKDYLKGQLENLEPYHTLAQSIANKIPVLVCSEHLKGASHAFKNQLNETAKSFSTVFDIPELNHHLMEGLRFPKSNSGHLHFLFITSDHYHSEVKRRYPLTMEVLKKNNISYSTYHLQSPNRLFDSLQLVQAGALVSFYISQIYDIDPGPVPWVDYFKDRLK